MISSRLDDNFKRQFVNSVLTICRESEYPEIKDFVSYYDGYPYETYVEDQINWDYFIKKTGEFLKENWLKFGTYLTYDDWQRAAAEKPKKSTLHVHRNTASEAVGMPITHRYHNLRSSSELNKPDKHKPTSPISKRKQLKQRFKSLFK